MDGSLISYLNNYAKNLYIPNIRRKSGLVCKNTTSYPTL